MRVLLDTHIALWAVFKQNACRLKQKNISKILVVRFSTV